MWEYIVKELRWKAGLLEDDWVFGIDVYDRGVVKVDNLGGKDLTSLCVLSEIP